ncbi:MAG: hypothetical protein ACXVAV_12445, partial [Ktedonobacteraceae bacterium]
GLLISLAGPSFMGCRTYYQPTLGTTATPLPYWLRGFLPSPNLGNPTFTRSQRCVVLRWPFVPLAALIRRVALPPADRDYWQNSLSEAL